MVLVCPRIEVLAFGITCCQSKLRKPLMHRLFLSSMEQCVLLHQYVCNLYTIDTRAAVKIFARWGSFSMMSFLLLCYLSARCFVRKWFLTNGHFETNPCIRDMFKSNHKYDTKVTSLPCVLTNVRSVVVEVMATVVNDFKVSFASICSSIVFYWLLLVW